MFYLQKKILNIQKFLRLFFYKFVKLFVVSYSTKKLVKFNWEGKVNIWKIF